MTHRAACGKIINSPARSAQETKRAKPAFLLIARVMIHLSFNVASATTPNSTHNM